MMMNIFLVLALLLSTLLKHAHTCYIFPSDIKDPCVGRKCSFGAKCVASLDGMSARCQCPEVCYNYGDSEGSTPVCGNDGVDYPNTCEMEKSSCREMKDVRKKYDGKCDPCKDVKCPSSQVCKLDSKRQPICRCFNTCTNNYSPVCANNGRTYANICFMDLDACKLSKNLVVISKGNCSQENNPCEKTKHCDYYAECYMTPQGGIKCICPEWCEKVAKPVCGSDGKTHDNICELKKHSCISKQWIKLIEYGMCSEDSVTSYSDLVNDSPMDFHESCLLSNYCEQFGCWFGAECIVTDDEVKCFCNNCTGSLTDEVCGTDERTYRNECELKRFACVNEKDVHVKHKGPCNQTLDCQLTKFGCCPDDNRFPSQGPNAEGCPEQCQCNVHGSIGPLCDAKDHLCMCKPGVGGSRCDRCEPSYWGFSAILEAQDGCLPCNCSIFGSVRTDCDQSTGRCLCKSSYSGMQCHICPNGEPVKTYGCLNHVLKNSKKCVNDLNCKYGGQCKKVGQHTACVCPASCSESTTDATSVVCGTNGHSYSSKCHLSQFSCRSQLNVTVNYYGPCSNNTDMEESVKFDGNFYLKYHSKLMDEQHKNASKIQFEFYTDAQNGIMFLESKSHTSSSDFIAIAVKKNKLVIHFNLGINKMNELPIITSASNVADKKWHLVTVSRSERLMKMTLDEDVTVVGYSKPGANSFISNGYFFLGGSHKKMKGLSKAFSTPFIGCLKNFRINGNTINLRDDRVNMNIEVEGCHEY